ncbi:5-methyltetrahydrofolate--homocysteine methyltransferase [Aestuariibacter sp. AA17]|uniref:5-methyltetrahydrofolate--homocysteine methyltransferase n=1 Tax=Fluctibacter corallii TaxID=2984329 RepID=A0ABT3A658_9ALTE|nr:5-methyltetrahydrofolate--homocysteine methyltransferase [Aestuariibacter sp. AA17]MCV2884171.1 5-methyltetrahydrofolate--homocysteine methyltransferase [Aestuariibacter sp. AA17]
MKHPFSLNLIAVTVGTLLLSGCGDAETNIVEKAPIETPQNDHNHDHHDHGDEGFTIESLGRLAVLSGESAELSMVNLDNRAVIDSFSLMHESNSLTASADYRFAVLTSRSQDYVGFIDGGLWREDHVAHLHDYEQAPSMSPFELAGSQPTHVVKHEGQMAIFYDGDAESNTPASVQVITDTNIANEVSVLPSIMYSINMHGVAEPRGEYLLATLRRDDAENTSVNKILPDQVGVFHQHNGEYELEHTLDVTCPNLHGAAQNKTYVAFGCGDGVLIAHQHGNSFDAEKIANIESLGDLRIGNLYGHEHSTSFFGIASAHGGSQSILLHVAPQTKSMTQLEWQPTSRVVSYGFSYDGKYFLVLESTGVLSMLAAHQHDNEVHWEVERTLAVSEQDTSAMPEGMRFSMTVAQNGPYAYVADPIANHVLEIHLDDLEVEGHIELSFSPSALSWLGIAKPHQHD